MSSVMRCRSGVMESSFAILECAASSHSMLSHWSTRREDRSAVERADYGLTDWRAPTTAKRFSPIYIMRRTQLYLDDHLWNALHARARSGRTTVSELVREALRQRYLAKRDEQMKAMQEFVGIRKERSEPLDAVEYVRSLRRG